ncbi:MAG: peptidase E [Acidimicrobiia bacterium]|nr:peptidase E [Acidimicrobiia bacterium]
MPDRHIVAMGGGGFASGPQGRALDDYALGLARSKRPKVCFVPTATGDSDPYIVQFYSAFNEKDCVPAHLELFTRTVDDLRAFLLDQDVIHVGGGNTANLLAVWRLHGVDDVMRAAWEAGIVLCGVSAGGLCWFEGGTTDSFGLDLAALDNGLGFLPGSFSPHYDGEAKRRPAYHEFVKNGSLPDGLAADNGVGLHFVGTELAEVVSTLDAASAYRVALIDGEVRETPIPTRLLTP